MTQSEKNIKLLEWAGWSCFAEEAGMITAFAPTPLPLPVKGYGSSGPRYQLPDLFTSLDALRPLELKLSWSDRSSYDEKVSQLCKKVDVTLHRILAGPELRAEALGITLGLWQ